MERLFPRAPLTFFILVSVSVVRVLILHKLERVRCLLEINDWVLAYHLSKRLSGHCHICVKDSSLLWFSFCGLLKHNLIMVFVLESRASQWIRTKLFHIYHIHSWDFSSHSSLGLGLFLMNPHRWDIVRLADMINSLGIASSLLHNHDNVIFSSANHMSSFVLLSVNLCYHQSLIRWGINQCEVCFFLIETLALKAFEVLEFNIFERLNDDH